MNSQLERISQDEERLYQAALVLAAIAEPEALRCLRRVATRPSSMLDIAAAENLEPDEVGRYLYDFAVAGLVDGSRGRSGHWQLTELGRLAWGAARPLIC